MFIPARTGALRRRIKHPRRLTVAQAVDDLVAALVQALPLLRLHIVAISRFQAVVAAGHAEPGRGTAQVEEAAAGSTIGAQITGDQGPEVQWIDQMANEWIGAG